MSIACFGSVGSVDCMLGELDHLGGAKASAGSGAEGLWRGHGLVCPCCWGG
jgi:hypothetical protein